MSSPRRAEAATTVRMGQRGLIKVYACWSARLLLVAPGRTPFGCGPPRNQQVVRRRRRVNLFPAVRHFEVIAFWPLRTYLMKPSICSSLKTGNVNPGRANHLPWI